MTSDIGFTADPISISLDASGWTEALPEVEAGVRRAIRAALGLACPGLDPDAGIAVLLSDDAELRDLNRTWRGKDAPTNVLSFPATETRAGAMPKPEFPGVPLELGDIALGFETCRREADEQGKALADHVTHLVIHGALHLLGYDHETDAEALIMEALETKILAGLGIADPYIVSLEPAHG